MASLPTRTVLLVGGPSNGTHPRIVGRVGHICTRRDDGTWQLYRRAGGDRYVHAGPCRHRHQDETCEPPRRPAPNRYGVASYRTQPNG